MNCRIILLPGDGIGPEVMDAALAVLNEVGRIYDITFNLTEELVGGCCYEKHGVSITDETVKSCRGADTVLLGAVGGPEWDSLPHESKPETALLRLREELGLYSNLRPAIILPQLAGHSPLKRKVINGLDLMIVRELTGGIYFGEPRGHNSDKGWNTLVYTREEVERIAHTAFQLAGKRENRVTSVHKANVLESSQFWKSVVSDVHRSYPEITLTDMYVDNAAMQLVSEPAQFDVILTQNMFGDILSDITGTLTGSLGMLPSASFGANHAMYEPVHGSAPTIAGHGVANPIGMIISIAMMFTYSLDLTEAGDLINKAVEAALANGYKTEDIASDNETPCTTKEMTDAIIGTINRMYEGTEASTNMERLGK
ncbi:MAG: 3-isopropylmalate dehydrogenase [Candidatus Neomarinimicrobiota bacterium]|nr:3-isopropylmalate dehydrogenase [Candidatus Neomarinimicrobiota bacterium]